MKYLSTMCILLLFSVVASADIIDFGATANSGGTGLTSYTINRPGYSVTLSAEPAAPSPPATLFWTSGKGYGVNYREGCVIILGCLGDLDPYQVDGRETLTLTFTGQTFLNSFTVSNYFNWTLLGIDLDNETTGQFSLNGGSWQDIGGGTAVGDKIINFGAWTSVDSIGLRIHNGTAGDDFSLRSLDIVSTPEPASIVFLGTVGVFSALLIRRRTKRA